MFSSLALLYKTTLHSLLFNFVKVVNDRRHLVEKFMFEQLNNYVSSSSSSLLLLSTNNAMDPVSLTKQFRNFSVTNSNQFSCLHTKHTAQRLLNSQTPLKTLMSNKCARYIRRFMINLFEHMRLDHMFIKMLYEKQISIWKIHSRKKNGTLSAV